MPFFHWLPAPTQLWIAQNRKLAWEASKAKTVDDGMELVEHASMLNRQMLSHLFPDASIITERFVGFAKSFIALRVNTDVLRSAA